MADTASKDENSVSSLLAVSTSDGKSPVTLYADPVTHRLLVTVTGTGFVSSVSNVDGSLTIAPTTGDVVASLNTGHANTWTGVQTFANNTIMVAGGGTGTTTLAYATTSGSGGLVLLPASTGTNTLAGLASAQTFTAANTFSGVFTASGTTASLGTSGSSSTINVGNGATTSGLTKNVNIGTGGLSGSTTTITIGSVNGTTTSFNSSVGIGTSSPNAKQENLSTTEQLRLSYDATHYASFTTDLSGNLNVTPITSVIVTRNVADANVALIVSQANASSTGFIQQWLFNGSSKAVLDNTGRLFATSLSNQTSSANATVSPATTGTTITRNVADANPALVVTQSNASSTGDVMDLKNSGGTVFSVGQGGIVTATAPVTLKGYTVAALPAGTIGMTAYVTDALAPTFGSTVTGGGSTVIPVFYNGTAWIAH